MHNRSSKWRKPNNKERNSKQRQAAKIQWQKRLEAEGNDSTRDANQRKSQNDRRSQKENNRNFRTHGNSTDTVSNQKVGTSTRKSTLFKNLNQQRSSPERSDSEYLFIHSNALHQISTKLQCDLCRTPTVIFKVGQRSGLAANLVFQCTDCGERVAEVESSPRIGNTGKSAFEINEKSVDAALSIGSGYSCLQTLCAKLDMNCMSLRTYHNHMGSVKQKAILFKEKVLEKSREAVKKYYNDCYPGATQGGVLQLPSSHDGTWHTRGFTSLYGIGFLIEYETGLVIDYVVLSKYCHLCTMTMNELGPDSPDFALWYKSHKEMGECNQNYTGSSGAMEVKCAEILYTRTVDYGVKCTTMVSHGDTKSHERLLEIQPYDQPIEKEECLNHVAKRLTTGLRQVVTVSRSKGITLGGRGEGALTDKVIARLGSYYRTAIVRNSDNVNRMQKDILATLYHCSSTDDSPDHSKCPKGKSSWCFYNRAKASKTEPKSHSAMMVRLNKKVVENIKPVYERLSRIGLLERCTKKATQNANEALHSLVWKKSQKSTSSSKDKVEIAAAYAVAEFNMGYFDSLELLAELDGKHVSDNAKKITEAKDRKRKRCSDSNSTAESKEARVTKKSRNKLREANKVRLEGQTYGAGLF